jgi:carboxylate-amine ligase
MGDRTRRPVRTVGVEEELLLVDAVTLHPTPAAGAIMQKLEIAGPMPGGTRSLLELEAKQEQIEVVSPPRETVEELFSTILEGRRQADSAARAVGARAVALGTGTLPCEPHLVSAPRYNRMQERFGLTMDEQLTCGFHVHVAVDSDDEGVGVLDRIRPWLPVLLALSANSPYWRGTDTGFASYRYQAWSRWPCVGSYDLVGSVAAYTARLESILDTEVSFDTGMLYFDARLSQHAPTVETRIADVCLRPAEAAVLAVLIRALVDTAASDWAAGVPADPVPTALLRLASWRASKSGVGDTLLDPRTSKPVPASSAVRALLEHVGGHFAGMEEQRLVRDGVEAILRNGSGAMRQRAVLAERGDCCEVVAAAAEETIAAESKVTTG